MIKLSYDMEVYRKDLDDILQNDDTVVELGCHVGRSTEFILERLGSNSLLISLDNSPEAVEPMNTLANNNENLKFLSGDVRLHDVLEKVVSIIDCCDVLSIDLGGGYHPDTVFKVYYIWASTLKPRDTLIRNKGLIDFVNSSKTSEKIESRDGWLESYGDQGIPPQIKEFRLWTDKLD